MTEKILKENILRPTACKVFKKELLYFFYGKSPYRSYSKAKAAVDPYTPEERFPTAVAINFDQIVSVIDAIFCTDTGFFHRNASRYSSFKLHQLKVGTDQNSLGIFFKAVWRNHLNYRSANISKNSPPINPLDLTKYQFLLDRYNELVTAYNTGSNIDFDDRVLAIEIQLFEKIGLDHSTFFIPETLLVALPDRSNRTATLIPFKCSATQSPEMVMGALNQKIQDYLDKKYAHP